MPTIQERRDDLLSIIKASKSVDMRLWQLCPFMGEYSETLDRLHPCGNKACIGGHLAISPMFISEGGIVSLTNAEPEFCEVEGVDAISLYLNTDPDATHAVITGDWFHDEHDEYCLVGGWPHWTSLEASKALELLYAFEPEDCAVEFAGKLSELYQE